MVIQTRLDSPVKTYWGTNRHKFEEMCWLLLQTCQTDRQRHEFLPSRPSPLGKTYRWCSGPWSTSQLHWSFSGKKHNINHPKWIGHTARISSEILVLLMQLCYYSFSSMICSRGSGRLKAFALQPYFQSEVGAGFYSLHGFQRWESIIVI